MKIGVFITARLKSSRLKQKILLDLNGRSVLDRVIDRCKSVAGTDGVVLCTSVNSQDSILYQNALNNNIQFFAGSEDDVLDRLLSAADYYGYDGFVSITADNPLFSIYYSQLAVDFYKNSNADFIFIKGLPIGCATYFLNTKALRVANFMKKESNTEIWGPFVNRPDFFNIGELIVNNSPFDEKTRLTCDYSEDYELLRKIYSYFPGNALPEVHEVFDILLKDKELLTINAQRTQIAVEEKVLNVIRENFDKQTVKGQEFARSMGKTLNPGLEILKVDY